MVQDCDVYLLDDVLAAVDAHVAAQLWERAICGPLLVCTDAPCRPASTRCMMDLLQRQAHAHCALGSAKGDKHSLNRQRQFSLYEPAVEGVDSTCEQPASLGDAHMRGTKTPLYGLVDLGARG